MAQLTLKNVEDYLAYLKLEERAPATLEKYRRDILSFYAAVAGLPLDKQAVIDYKSRQLQIKKATSVNSMLAAINGLLEFIGRGNCKVKRVKIQRSSYLDERKVLTKEEYFRLVKAAATKKDERLELLLQTICSTGMRVSELQYITVEAIRRGVAEVRNKGKCRTVILPQRLCLRLKLYCRRCGRKSGLVFTTRSGRAMDRTNIWAMMKALCRAARVEPGKVYPHSLRHLFARCFYKKLKDIEHLSSILGHSNINTTRIYTQTTGQEHRSQIEQLNLLL